MKKNVVIILIVFAIILVIVSVQVYTYRKSIIESEKINKEYQNYYNVEVLGTTLISLINKTIDYNEKNSVKKDDNNLYYIDDGNKSIIIYVKFLENDKTFSMEDIAAKQIENFVKFYAMANFKCTSIEYHNTNKSIKSLYFEQV